MSDNSFMHSIGGLNGLRKHVQVALGLALAAQWGAAQRGAAQPGVAAPVYPLKVGPTGRYLVDARDKPFLLAGESPQAMMVNISEADADLFFANRRGHGFNAAWINLLCATYTGGRADSSTIDGLKPFTTADDFATPNEAYFAHCDRVLRLAAKHDTLVILDPAETGSYLRVMQRNGVEKCRDFGRYLGRRYAGFDNIVWMHGNDYGDHSAANDAYVTAVALGIQEFDKRHLHTIELNAGGTFENSIDDERWTPLLGLNAAYTYGPTYVPILKAYNQQHRIPTFMVESGYEFEHLQPQAVGTARQLRLQEYWSDLSGSTGQLYGNGSTWPFKADWKDRLDTPGAIQMVYLQRLLEPRTWWQLVPDQEHKVVTAGYGTLGQFDYVTAARTPDGSLIIAYVPDQRTVTVDMTQLAAPARAQWYDPSNGRYRAIANAPLPNTGTRRFDTPDNNADGPGRDGGPANADWVLVLETHPPGAAAGGR